MIKGLLWPLCYERSLHGFAKHFNWISVQHLISQLQLLHWYGWRHPETIFLFCRERTNRTILAYEQHLLLIHLPTLEHKRLVLGIGFLLKFIQRDISSLVLLGLILIHKSQVISFVFGCRSVEVIMNSFLLFVFFVSNVANIVIYFQWAIQAIMWNRVCLIYVI